MHSASTSGSSRGRCCGGHREPVGVRRRTEDRTNPGLYFFPVDKPTGTRQCVVRSISDGLETPIVEVAVLEEPLVFEVHGRTVVVEASPDGWRAHYREDNGAHRSAHELRIPSWVSADEMPRFLGGIIEPVRGKPQVEVRRVW